MYFFSQAWSISVTSQAATLAVLVPANYANIRTSISVWGITFVIYVEKPSHTSNISSGMKGLIFRKSSIIVQYVITRTCAATNCESISKAIINITPWRMDSLNLMMSRNIYRCLRSGASCGLLQIPMLLQRRGDWRSARTQQGAVIWWAQPMRSYTKPSSGPCQSGIPLPSPGDRWCRCLGRRLSTCQHYSLAGTPWHSAPSRRRGQDM